MTEHQTRLAIVAKEDNGCRLDIVLAKLFPDYSRSQLSQWLKQGMITIDGLHKKPKDKVIGGEQIIFCEKILPRDAQVALTAENLSLDIVFEDEFLLVLNKPAGLVVHPGAGNFEHTLVHGILFHHPYAHHLPRAGIVHRLDKDTTGLLIVAKTLAAHTQLIRQMQAREIHRCYMALVQGRVSVAGRIETNYGRHPKNRLKMAVCTQGKEAVTDYTIKKIYKNHTLLDVTLHTGRTHQIRVHMAHIKHPVVGDPLYGVRGLRADGLSDTLRQRLSIFQRQALHAYTLTLLHPILQYELTLTAPLPDDFQMLLTALEHDLA